MLPSVRTGCYRFILLLLTCTLLGSCTAHPRHSGFSGGSLRLDTETVGRMRYDAALRGAGGAAASTVVRAAASTIGLLAPEVLGVFQNDEEELSRLEAALLECVQRAERDINAERFSHGTPSAADCKTVVGVDWCGRPIYQSMELGNLKHARALACMQDILKELWPGPVSIEQRYRFYRHAKVLETVSREQEKRLLMRTVPKSCGAPSSPMSSSTRIAIFSGPSWSWISSSLVPEARSPSGRSMVTRVPMPVRARVESTRKRSVERP